MSFLWTAEFPKGDDTTVIAGLNAEVGSDNTLFEHVMGKHDLKGYNDNGKMFVTFCSHGKLPHIHKSQIGIRNNIPNQIYIEIDVEM